MTYDSIAEENAAPIFAKENYFKTSSLLNLPLYDMKEVEFQAYADFLCLLADWYPVVEFKAAPLNTITSKASSKTKAATLAARHAGNSAPHIKSYIELQSGFNHSVYKQAEVTAKHPPLSYIIVFLNIPTREEAELYMKHGLVFCTLAGFHVLLNLIKFVKKGIPLSFMQILEDGTELNLHLGAIYLTQQKAQAKRDDSKRARKLAFHGTTTEGCSLEEFMPTFPAGSFVKTKPRKKKVR